MRREDAVDEAGFLSFCINVKIRNKNGKNVTGHKETKLLNYFIENERIFRDLQGDLSK